MALMITDECIGCGVCLPECPHQAICEEDGNFWIRAGRCTECAEDPEGPHCRRLCPMPEVIVGARKRVKRFCVKPHPLNCAGFLKNSIKPKKSPR